MLVTQSPWSLKCLLKRTGPAVEGGGGQFPMIRPLFQWTWSRWAQLSAIHAPFYQKMSFRVRIISPFIQIPVTE